MKKIGLSFKNNYLKRSLLVLLFQGFATKSAFLIFVSLLPLKTLHLYFRVILKPLKTYLKAFYFSVN